MTKKIYQASLFLILSLLLAACAGIAATDDPPVVEDSSIETEVGDAAEETHAPTLDEVLSLGNDAASRGEWDEAIEFYDLALTMGADVAQTYVLRGNAYLQLDNVDQALLDYGKAISLDPLFASAYNSRGLAYVEAGDSEQALQDFAKAIELQPSFALAYKNRSAIQIEQGNTEAAILDLQIYLSLVPNAPDRAAIEEQIAALQAQPEPTAISEDGLIYYDDFSDPSSGWYSNGDPSAVTAYASPGMRIVVTQEASAVWVLPGRLFNNARIEVVAEKQGGDDDNFFGVMCRVQGTTDSANFYVLMISSDGYYGIGKRVDGGELVLVGAEKMQRSEAINLGEADNTIVAECNEDRLSLSVNGELVMEVTDPDLSTGQIGLIAGTFEIPGTNILFKEVSVYTPESSE